MTLDEIIENSVRGIDPDYTYSSRNCDSDSYHGTEYRLTIESGYIDIRNIIEEVARRDGYLVEDVIVPDDEHDCIVFIAETDTSTVFA